MRLDVDAFTRGFEGGERHPEIAHALWELLRERAFVRDFRPEPEDDLYRVFAMDAEIVRDEVIHVLLAKLNLSVSGLDFSGFDFASIETPQDVFSFLKKVADAQNDALERRFVDMTK